MRDGCSTCLLRTLDWSGWLRRGAISGAALVLLVFAPKDAQAQVEPAAGERSAEPVVTAAPRPMKTVVEYPEPAQGDARVLLELVIDTEGRVERATVLFGASPFAEAALQSAQHWLFEPAQRAGEPVVAKIRYEVRFTEEQRPPPSAPAPSAPEPALPVRAPATDQVIEVVVRGETPPGVISFSRAEAREIPGSFGDPVRAVEVMPGVTPLISGVPLYYVRGAPPGNVGYFIDGVRVPLLYHAFLGPSVLHPAMIDRVTLYPGGYPAEHGRFAGGIVNLDLAEVRSELHAEASIRLIDAGAFVSTPLDGGRARLMGGGRYSYTALVLTALSPVQLDYWDYHLLAEYDLTSRDTLGVFAFGSYEFFAEDISAPEQQSGEALDFFGTEFHRIDIRYDRRLSARGRARVAITWGKDETRLARGYVDAESIGLRTELDAELARTVDIKAGADVRLEGFDMDILRFSNYADDIQALFPARSDWTFGTYLSFPWRPVPWVEFTPGVRADYYRSAGASALGIDPRLLARFEVNPDLDLFHNVGIAHQIPNYVPNVPGAVVAGLPGGLQRSLQSSSGLETKLGSGFTLTGSVFQNVYLSLTDPTSTTASFVPDALAAEERAIGSAVGLELELRRPLTHRLGGLLSYTLSRSTRSRGSIESLSAFDRPHVVNLAISYDLGKRWRLGARGVFYSGVPAKESLRNVFNRGRGRPFLRADLRLEKRFRLGDRGWWGPVAELQNATLSSEVTKRVCGDERCTDTVVGPLLLPGIGVEAVY